jgi:hypothetical protein
VTASSGCISWLKLPDTSTAPNRAVKVPTPQGNGDEAGGLQETFPEDKSGQARDRAAERMDADVSGETLEKGKKVKNKPLSATEDGEDVPDRKRPGPVRDTVGVPTLHGRPVSLGETQRAHY